MKIGCPVRWKCYMSEYDCYFSQRYQCIHYDQIIELDRQKEERAKKRLEEINEDVRLQMELQR